MKWLDLFRKPVATEAEPYPGHPSEFPNDPFERWMVRLMDSRNAVQLYYEAKGK